MYIAICYCSAIILVIFLILLVILDSSILQSANGALVLSWSHSLPIQSPQGPTINDSHLKAQVVFRGLRFPTSMAFLGPNDILVLEKNDGTVRRIVNGTMLQQPLLHVNVANDGERGLLGIDVSKPKSGDGGPYVFLYYTQLGQRKNTSNININGSRAITTQPATCNGLYRYELVNNKLINPKLLLNLPATPGPYHNGGKIVIGPDNNIYVVIGDVFGHRTKAQNFVNGTDPDGTSGILRVTQEGKAVGDSGIFGNKFPLNLYYAYGIRNSFGMDFDPLTGRLWDTENGPAYGDEINLVQPGFNSGWEAIQGIWKPVSKHLDIFAGAAVLHPNNLVTFQGRGKYRMPEFIWYQPAGPTAIKFLNSSKLGKQYQNDMFVADFHHGNIYHFKLNQNRTGLALNDSLLANRRIAIANNINDLKGVTFGHGFGGITDMQVGPDGYLYVLSLYEGGNNCAAVLYANTPCISYTSPLRGTIFRIVPTNTQSVR